MSRGRPNRRRVRTASFFRAGLPASNVAVGAVGHAGHATRGENASGSVKDPMASPDETASHRLLGGRYRLLQRLGERGRSSAVYEAFDQQQERAVAVKLIDPNAVATPELLAQFRTVAEQLTQVNHPNIVAVHDYGFDDVDGVLTPYLVMELLAGGSLRAILDRGRTLSPSQALLIGLDLCRGLDHAHRRGLVHGDVKPSNMLFGDDRRLKLADFGLSRLVAQSLGHRASDLDLSSARYASPEQALEKRIDGRSDVYSVALVLVESVTGQVPFAGDTTVATLANRVDRLLPVSADLGALAAVLERAGRPKAADRTSSAELGRALMQAAGQMPRPAPLPLVQEGTSLFDAPAGQETTTELTRFADQTGQLLRDPSGAISRDPTAGLRLDPTGSVLRDPSGAIPRDPTGGMRRDPTGQIPRDGSGSIPRDPSGALRRDPTGSTPRPRVVAVDEHGRAQDVAPTVGRKPIFTWMALALGVIVLGAVSLIGWRKLHVPSYEVPVLTGLELSRANNEIAEFEWEVEVRRERSDSQELDRVLSTDPLPGTKLKRGAAFVMVVSDGPTLSTLPELTGRVVAEAGEALAAVGLAADAIDEQFSEDIAPGTVIQWLVPASPELTAGAEVVKGTKVKMIVSKGPAPRRIDDMTGQTLEAVTAWYAAQGVTIAPAADRPFSDDIPAGSVISQSVQAGDSVDRGATVEVVISNGVDVVAIPAVTGLTYDAAKAALEAAQFVVGSYTGNYFTGTINGLFVGGTAVVDGQMVKRGSTVDLSFVT